MQGRGRMQLTIAFVSALGWIAMSADIASAHADLSEQIERVSQQIEREQDAPALEALHLRRADLYVLHRDWDGAREDLERAEALSPGSPQVAFRLGKLLLDSDRPNEALTVLDSFVVAHPEHTGARIARARALVRAGRSAEGGAEYDRVLDTTHDPHLYLERARAVAANSQRGTAAIDEALRGLDRGIAALGPLVTLQLHAIELELAEERYDAALARLDTVIAQTRRKESGLARRAAILERAGRANEAEETYREARTAIAALPHSRRETPAVVELAEEIEVSLARLSHTNEGTRVGRGDVAPQGDPR